VEHELTSKAREIVACARGLLATGGYHSFSYADIAEKIKLSKPTIHHHFPTKADLVNAIVTVYRQDALTGLSKVEKHVPGPIKQLHAYVNFWANCLHENESAFCVCALLAAELPGLPSSIAHEVRGHFDDLADWLASVLERGGRDGVFVLRDSPRTEGRVVMAAVHGAMLSARAYASPALFSEILQPVMARLIASA
jgi:TetR/AcrR family transcriptional repressor of nem operon